MEAQQRSRKRKQPPSNPLSGIVTRKKAQIFFHHNRSGKSRLDPLRKPSSFPSPMVVEHQKSSRNVANGDEAVYLMSIKDLRARRIFSTPQSEGLTRPNEVEHGKDLVENPSLSMATERCDIVVDFKEDESNVENPRSLVASTVASSEKGEISGCADVGLDCIEKSADNLNPNTSDRDLKRVKGENLEVFTDENVQTTPPDAVIHVQRNEDGNSCSRSSSKEISPIQDKKISSDSKKNMVMKPCSRMRVFKAPNSFSYRRLLPYLMDIAKDTCASNVNSCPKIEVDVVETPKLDEVPLTIQSCLLSQEVSSNSNEEKLSLVPKGCDLEIEQTAVETPVHFSQDKSPTNLVFSTNHIDEQTTLNSSGKLQEVCLIAKPEQADSSLVSKESPEVSKTCGNLDDSCKSLLLVENESRNTDVELKMDESPISVVQSSMKLEAIVSSGFPAANLAKGILKRNPRGCRGVCDCIDCASFRLNAGRAFDFSRNHMLDTEELVLYNVKELSNLQVMLENAVNCGNNHVMLPADQVQEVCRRICNMEDITKIRLSQMKEDVYIHCRTKLLERPRVNFSSHVEEKTIGK